MRKIGRLVLGILLGAFLGAALIAGTIYALPEEYGLHTIYFGPLVSFLQLVFGHLADNPAHCLEATGAVIGAVTGIFLVRAIPHPKFWLAMLSGLLVGMVIGAMAIYRPGKNAVEWMSAVWEQSAASERAWAYLRGLQAMDQMTTNRVSITKFEVEGRTALANYLHETESREQIWKGAEPVDFIFTNSAAYHIVQKYLATHTNSLSIQRNSPLP